jgi:hypothetical protein
VTPDLPEAPVDDGPSGALEPTQDPGTPTSDNCEAYVSQRIQVPVGWSFANDRDTHAKRPGFHIFGKCPNCHGDTTGVCATEYLAEGVPMQGTDRAVASFQADFQTPLRRVSRRRAAGQPSKRRTQITVLRCACTRNHASSPAGTFGCGSEWLLRVEYSLNNAKETTLTPVSAEEASHYWPAADAAAAEVPDSLATAQAAAKNWGAGLTAVLTLLGVGALFANRTSVQSLGTAAQVVFAALAFVAVVANAVMLYQSTFATYGSPSVKDALKPSDLWNADLDPLMQAAASMRRLQTSVWATGVAVVAALGAAGILLLASSTPTPVPPATAKITFTLNGIPTTTPCDTMTLTPLTTPPTSTLTVANTTDGTSETIALSAITAVAAC